MKVLCIGESYYDINILTNYYPVENTKNTFSEKVETTGGLIPNIAYFLGSNNIETYIATTIGSDDYGNIIKKDLTDAKVNTDYIETSYSGKSNILNNIYNDTNKTNTSYKIKNDLALKKYSFNITPDYLVIDGTEYSASLAALDKYKDSQTVLIMNELTKENTDLAKYCKIIIFSKEAAEAFANYKIDYNNGNSIVELYNNIRTKLPNVDIIINISMYGVVYSLNNEIKIIPTLNSVIRIDLSSEMESFVSAYLYAKMNNVDIENSIIYGIIAGSLATTKVGLRSSIPKLDEITSYYNSKFNIQTQPVQNPTTPVNEVVNNDNTQNS